MNSYQINEQLSALNMKTMKLEYQRQCELPAMSDLSFDERFAMIVNAQYTARQEARIKRMIKNAKLRDETASLAGIDYDPVRKLQKSKVAELSDCEWIRNGFRYRTLNKLPKCPQRIKSIAAPLMQFVHSISYGVSRIFFCLHNAIPRKIRKYVHNIKNRNKIYFITLIF